MASVTSTVSGPSARSAAALKAQVELSHAKRGLGWGVLSGATWGLDGVLLGAAFSWAPFVGAQGLYAASLASAALHDGLAGLWLFLYNLFTGRWRELWRTLRTKPGMIVFAGAMFGGPIAMSGYLLGINMATPAYALAITAMYPAVGALLAAVFLKERIGPRVWLGILTCIAGAIVVSWSSPEGDYPHFYLGLGLALLATFGWGMEGVLSTYGMDVVDPAVAINIRELGSFFVYLIVVLPAAAVLGAGAFGVFGEAFQHTSILIIALAGFMGGLSYLAWYRALNMSGVGRAMALNITYALWAIVFSALLSPFIKSVYFSFAWNLIVGAVVIAVGAILVVAKPSELIKLRNVEG